MADLTKYSKGKRMVREDLIKQIEQNKADIEALKGQVEEIPIVEANPVLGGEEEDLTSLQVGETKYKVPQPTEVVANPTLAGTEANLEGLQVGETKYKVGGGSLYLHTITIGVANTYTLTFSLCLQTNEELNSYSKLVPKMAEGKLLLANGVYNSNHIISIFRNFYIICTTHTIIY